VLTDELYNGEQLLFVVDDFRSISDSEILYFFRNLVEANLENFCLLLISNAKTDIGLAALHEDRLFQITQEDLKFTPDETRHLFSHYGHDLTAEKINEIASDIDGWPMALYLLAQHPGGVTQGTEKTKLGIVYEMFERDFFSAYAAESRKRLIKLSMIHWFPHEILKKLGYVEQDKPDGILRTNLFIVYDYNSKLYKFHNMYRLFLSSKLHTLDEEEKRGFWQTAGETFLSLGHYLEAIDCFEQSGNPGGMLDAMAGYMRKFVVYSREHSNYLQKKLSLLGDEFIAQNPLAEFLNAACLVNKLELERAYEILQRLSDKLCVQPEKKALLGEVYWLMGQINMMWVKPVFAHFFKLSSDCLPEGALTKGYLHIRNVDVLSLPDNKPGAMERMEKELYEAMPYYVKAAKGSGSGLEYLYSAEMGYFTFDFAKAKQNAHKAIYTAMDTGQHDILCNGHIILSRTAIMQGDFSECEARVTFVRDYINERKITELYEMRDCAMAGLHVAAGDYASLPRWIVSPELNIAEKDRPIAIGGREKIIQAEYLLGAERYDELIGFLDYHVPVYRKQGRWVDVLKCLVLRSVALLKAPDLEAALNAFFEAYDMAYGNKVITPFIESGINMRRMTEIARKNMRFNFDPEWLDDINRKSATHAKRIARLASEYYRNVSFQTVPQRKLSKRETDVLNTLSQGLTREEIASANSLSINTVKSVIKSVYNKLGAVNCADAVRIATSLRLLK
jgi:LuxR family maltose regulon positive regulatory protein